MKLKIARIATAVWVSGLVLSSFILSVPPARVPLFIGLAGIGSIPLFCSHRRYQIIGLTAVVGSLSLAYLEHQSGLRLQKRKLMEIQRQEANSKTNSSNHSPQ